MTVITLEELNLLLRSEEPKKKDKYGNLFEVLSGLGKVTHALSDKKLTDLDEKGKEALTFNKRALFDLIMAEWSVKNKYNEDLPNKVQCSLCNTKNKYIYFIVNKYNLTELNVGSSCIKKFGGIREASKVKDVKKIYSEMERRSLFHREISDFEEKIAEASKFFQELPILLPIRLYEPLKKIPEEMRKAYDNFIRNGVPNEINKFKELHENFLELQKEAKGFVENNKNKKLICRKDELKWLEEHNEKLLLEISRNDGVYTLDTLKGIHSGFFIIRNLNKILPWLDLKMLEYVKTTSGSVIFSFNHARAKGYPCEVLINVPIKAFMEDIGADCIFGSEILFDDRDIIAIGKVAPAIENIDIVFDFLNEKLKKMGYRLLHDYKAEKTYLYRLSDKAVKKYGKAQIVNNYWHHVVQKEQSLEKFLKNVTATGGIWIGIEEQKKFNEHKKFNELFRASL